MICWLFAGGEMVYSYPLLCLDGLMMGPGATFGRCHGRLSSEIKYN